MFTSYSASHMPSRCGSRQSASCDAENIASPVIFGHAAAACLFLFAAASGIFASLLLALTGLLGSLIRLISGSRNGARLQPSHL